MYPWFSTISSGIGHTVWRMLYLFSDAHLPCTPVAYAGLTAARRIVLELESAALLALNVPYFCVERGLSAMMAYSWFLDGYKLLLFG